MLKKILRWVAICAPIVLVLPLFITCWNYVVETSGAIDSSNSVLLGLFPNYAKAFEYSGDNVKEFNAEYAEQMAEYFSTGLMTFTAIMVIVALVAGLALAALYLLNDFKVLKLAKLEKLGAIVYGAIAIVLLLLVVICAIANANVEIASGWGQAVTASYVPTAIMWISSILAVGGGVCAFLTAKKK